MDRSISASLVYASLGAMCRPVWRITASPGGYNFLGNESAEGESNSRANLSATCRLLSLSDCDAVYLCGIAMRFAVTPMRRNGRPIGRHELANCKPAVGDLRVEEVRDAALGRYVRTARVIDVTRPRDPDLLPALLDPSLVAMSPLAFTLSGFERVDDRDYAQSWLVRAV
jgi:hypothetical protein